ncbi:MAG: lipocalin family protein [Bdellovibrionales bacterium]|nr:lipocalin family protein [Bdellovibrionales bacterium]
MKKLIIFVSIMYSILGTCSSLDYRKTVKYVDLERFMGDWYVIAGRVTFLEKNAYNPIESYTWNSGKKRIDINFTFNKGSFLGKKKSIPQKGYIHNDKTFAHWKISPIWPLKLDYLVIELDQNYQWTVIGVPSQKYLWIMARTPQISNSLYSEIMSRLEIKNYNHQNVKMMPQQ